MTDNKNPPELQKPSLTFISRSAPYGNNRANLCLDMALAGAVFEQEVSYIFLDDGVFQALRGQDAAAIESKSLGNALETLALYGIEEAYVDSQSLEERGLESTDLLSGLRLIDTLSITKLIRESDTVFNL